MMSFFPDDYGCKGGSAIGVIDEERGIFLKKYKLDFLRDYYELVANELEIMEALSGLGISPTCEWFREDEEVILGMGLIRGYDFSKRDVGLPILFEAAKTLRDFHCLGLVHGDISPGNFIFDEEEEKVKLVDFALTADGEIRGCYGGTISYMSPEQIYYLRGDFRSDIYSFGWVMYEMLLGRHPFEDAENKSDLVNKQLLQRPEHLHGVDPSIPWWVGDIVARCLQKRPKDRYQNMEEVVSDLRDAL